MKEFKINGVINVPDDMTEYQFWGYFIDLIEDRGWEYSTNEEVQKEIAEIVEEINKENIYDMEVSNKDYKDHVQSGEKSFPIEKVWEELDV